MKNAEEITAWLKRIDNVLGFIQTGGEVSLTDEEEEMIRQRTLARKNGEYKKADEIRDKLLGAGIEVRDTKDGSVWKKIR